MVANSQNLVQMYSNLGFLWYNQLELLGCCPDDFTAARGDKMEGCGCYSTENGCCPDKFTPSPGPDGKVRVL